MKEVFEKIVGNFTKHFEDNHDKDFTTQNVKSCMGIYEMCLAYNPDTVIEMGTNHGASTLSICLAMTKNGKSLSAITTMDLSHKAWSEAAEIHKDVPEIAAMDLSQVKYITGDFKDLEPLKRDGRVLVFYDIHDHTYPLSEKFLDEWLIEIKNGMILIHDMSIVADDYALPQVDTKRSKAKCNNGNTYAGFAECEVFIKFANDNGATVKSFHSGISFEVKDGKFV